MIQIYVRVLHAHPKLEMFKWYAVTIPDEDFPKIGYVIDKYREAYLIDMEAIENNPNWGITGFGFALYNDFGFKGVVYD